MAGKAQELGGPIRIADYLSLGLLARLVPPSLVHSALEKHEKQSQRIRALPAHAVVYYVMALAMYQGVNAEEVLRMVTEGMAYLGDGVISAKVGKSGISAARTRLGADVMQTIAATSLTPLADEVSTPSAFYRGLRLVSLDGSTLEVADEVANREAFGVPGTNQGRTGYPQLRFVGLLESGTHAMFGITLGGYKDAEITLAHETIKHLKPGYLCLADRGFAGYPIWQSAMKTGANLLWRVPKNRLLPAKTRFADGSYLSEISPAPATKQKRHDEPSEPITVRVIDYQMPGIPDVEPVYRLITTLLDPVAAPAQELAELYHARWSIETTFGEIKTTLKGSEVAMRSKKPDLVQQEFWGLILAHHVVRKLMLEAALLRERPPTDLSFKHSLTLLRRKLPASGAIPPRAIPQVVGWGGE